MIEQLYIIISNNNNYKNIIMHKHKYTYIYNKNNTNNTKLYFFAILH